MKTQDNFDDDIGPPRDHENGGEPLMMNKTAEEDGQITILPISQCHAKCRGREDSIVSYSQPLMMRHDFSSSKNTVHRPALPGDRETWETWETWETRETRECHARLPSFRPTRASFWGAGRCRLGDRQCG